jgi:hypothetical protein
MGTKLSPAIQARIARELEKGNTDGAIAKKLGVHSTTVLRYRHRGPAPNIEVGPEQIEDGVRTALRRGRPMTAGEMAEQIGTNAAEVRKTIKAMKDHGALIMEHPGGIFDLAHTAAIAPTRHVFKGAKGEVQHRFGVLGDSHLCNRHARLDVLKAAYDYFERMGIDTVLHSGNYIDGEARFNKQELLTAPGMDRQFEYFIDKYPVREGITTFFIDGDDHEGWYAQREGILPGRHLQKMAEDDGRHDLKYLGYGECDLALQYGAGEAVGRLLHPGGGSAYATSYALQKIVESYQGGEKPHVIFAGHYHKAEYGYPREVHCLQTGCTEDQTLFMRKQKIGAHVGFWDVKIRQDARGAISGFAPEWFPFYDRGYYQRRYW